MERQIRTDLAREALEMHRGAKGITARDEDLGNGITVNFVEIMDEYGAKEIGKPIGKYITIEALDMPLRDPNFYEKVSKALSNEIMRLAGKLGQEDTVLIIGLGNRYVTPDALGPCVVENVTVSRHVTRYLPEVLSNKVRSLCAFAPGVLGVTGIETAEAVQGIVEQVKPQLVIAIDALASRSTDRIRTTIQLCDTGIQPGSGLGNRRMNLNRETLGVPVIAIGVPTVVHASTISQDAVSIMLDEMGEKAGADKLTEMIGRIMNEHVGPLIVTPKEIDQIIEDCAKIVADAINLAVHDINWPELQQLLH